MSIATEITRLNNAKAAIKSAIEAKGVEVSQDAKIDLYADYIEQIPQGGGEYEPICFTSLEDGNTFKLNKAIAISVDGKQTWQTLAANTPSPAINTGEKIYFKATENASPFTEGYSNYQFSTAKTCNVSGHPYSLYAKFSIYSFQDLFNGTKVVDVSGLDLSESMLTSNCYFNMFSACTSLTTAPELPATKLAESCYHNMFSACTSLTTAPELPATKLAANCYASMFYGCTSLTTAPELPATTLANQCYYSMFRECTSLTTAPELPATTLRISCYYQMFYGCTSLTTAPELPATTLANQCYANMFYGCSSLNYIKALFTTNPSNSYTDNWVKGVAYPGTFVKNKSATWTNTGTNAVPYGWTVEVSLEYQYLTFIPVVDATFKWAQPSSIISGHLEYSTDGGQTWTTIASYENTPTITAGSKVMWRGNLVPSTSSGGEGIGTFSATGNYNAYGNTMSLLFYNNYQGRQLDSTEYNYAFKRLFYNDTHILSAPLLPATTLSYGCCWQMFYKCTNLVTAPELPAATLAIDCYTSMFQDCTKLTTAPELPATTLASGCYLGMFRGCTSLVTAPELPATTLEANCYQSMFQGTSLTVAPELPATTLANSCYNAMFRDCTSLVTAPELPATTLANYCYQQMFINCSSLVTAPALPATTLITWCYYYMFYNCNSLNYVKCLATDISATNCTKQWLSAVASTGTFVKSSAATWTTTGDNGIPTGWTVVDDNS